MGNGKTTHKGTHGVLVQMPVDLHAQLRQLAERKERSVNKQIVYAIRQHVEAEEAAA